MALPRNRTNDEFVLTAFAADITTATSVTAFVQVPCKAEILQIGTIIHAAIGTTDTVITAKVNGTTVTGCTATLTASGSGAGTVARGAPSNATAAAIKTAQVNEGDSISFVSGFEADDGTVPAQHYVILRKRRN